MILTHKDLGSSIGKQLDINYMNDQEKAEIVGRILMHVHTFATCEKKPESMSYQTAVAFIGGAFIKYAEDGTSYDKNFNELIKVILDDAFRTDHSKN